MNREFDAWMRDYHNRMQYGLDPERRYVKRPKKQHEDFYVGLINACGMAIVFWAILAGFIYRLTR